MENSNSHRSSNHLALYTETPPTQASQFRPRSQQTSHQRRESCSNYCVRRLILTMILLFLTISAITFIAWFVLHPHDPVFRVDSLVVSNLNLSNSHLSSNYELKLNVKNPNQKLNVSFEDVHISIYYQKISLSETSVKSFELGKMSQAMVSAMLQTDSAGVSLDKRMAKDMDGDLSKMQITFEVRILIGVQYKSNIWPSKQRGMKVSCKNLIVKFKSAKVMGRFNGGKKDCFVYLL